MSLTPQVVSGAPDGAPSRRKQPFLTPAELADAAQVSDQAVHVWLARHPGLGLKLAGRWRIRPEVAAAILSGAPLTEAARLGRAGR